MRHGVAVYNRARGPAPRTATCTNTDDSHHSRATDARATDARATTHMPGNAIFTKFGNRPRGI